VHVLYKVVVLSPLPEGLVGMFFSEHLERHKIQATFVTVNEPDMERLRGELSDADMVVGDYTFKVPITAEMCEWMPRVKLIAQPSTGYDHIDVDACRRKRIPVSNIGGANAVSVAEHTLALALMLLKRIGYAHQRILQGVWTQQELMSAATELSGKVWGIIGLGRIGREVSARARAMGADVQYTDLQRLGPEEEEVLGVKFGELRRLLADSDVVSIHVPLTETNRKMIGVEELRLMKSNAIFVNVSRGELVDEEALAKAVTQGWIGGAGVDVFSVEPVVPDSPLVRAARDGANLVLTPHIGGATSDARMRIIQVTVENVLRVMLGQNPMNVVNK